MKGYLPKVIVAQTFLYEQEKKLLTYEEALKTKEVIVYDEENYEINRYIASNKHSAQAMLVFDLAERRNYRMEKVNV